MDLDGKATIITGAAAGIGRATALAFARQGARLLLVDRDPQGGAETTDLAHQAGAQAHFAQADVARTAEVQAYVRRAVHEYGTIDCFFNNAGIEGRVQPTAEYDEDTFDAVIAVNVKGVFLGLRHVIPVMAAQGHGAIVNTASTAALAGSPGLCAYVASKHAVLGLTRTAATEYGPAGIRVNAVCPGPIDTRMIHSIAQQSSPNASDAVRARVEAAIPIGRYGRAEEVAALVLFLCSPHAASITGGHYLIDGGRMASPGGAVGARPPA